MKLINCDYSNQNDSFALSTRHVAGYSTMPSSHFHDTYELYYLVSGKRYYFIEDRTFEINPGDIVLIKSYDLHKTTDAGRPDHERLLFNFTKNFFPVSGLMDEVFAHLFDQRHGVFTFSPTGQQYLEELFSKMILEVKNQSIGFEAALQALLTQALIYMARHSEYGAPGIPKTHPSPMHEKILDIVQYINARYMDPLTLDFISDYFYISPYYFSRSFKQSTGFTFIEYLNSVRIREAQRLLRDTNRQVIQIADAVGFNNLSHFGRVFKSITKFTPLQYRQIYKQTQK
ncbi:MAG: AraC family transcriptional regulator [Epulopiscium sp.]|nr:AraC family transcriptional regulator [Candidatus Epulonipiscium sp.]